MQQYNTQYGTIFAVREYKGHPAIMLRAEHKPDDWSLSSMIEPFTPGAWTAEELQAQLDNWAAVKGWRSVEDPAGSETREIADRMCTSVNSARGRMRSYMKHRSDEFVGVEDKRGRKRKRECT